MKNNVINIQTGKPSTQQFTFPTLTEQASPPTPNDFAALVEGENGVSLRAQTLRLLCMGHELNRFSGLTFLGTDKHIGTYIYPLKKEWGIEIFKASRVYEDGNVIKRLNVWILYRNPKRFAMYYNILLAKGYQRANGDKTPWPM